MIKGLQPERQSATETSTGKKKTKSLQQLLEKHWQNAYTVGQSDTKVFGIEAEDLQK